jgi:hypothetical protein
VLATEIELAALHSQFVATSEEIAKDLSLLAGRIDEEPTEVRESQLAAAKEIAAAQERLRLEVDRLAGPPDQCVAIMRAMLEAQEAAQQQLAVIIKRHRPSTLLRTNLDERLANMARQLKASAAASRLADESRVQLPTNIRGIDRQAPRVEAQSGSGKHLSSADEVTSEEMQSPSLPLALIVKAGTSLALLLAVASAGLALFFLYASLPSAWPRREVGAEQALREPAQLAAARRAEGPPQIASAASSPPTNASKPKAAAPLSTTSIAATTPNVDVPVARLPRSDPLPSHSPAVPSIPPDRRQPGVSATAAQAPVTPNLAPPSPTYSNDAETFVPVVFTHKDRGTAQRTFAELQRRYPRLMAHRRSELQMVDTGKNGIWYRLVILPAGSHQEASETCGHLQAAGYTRCWVKAY